MAIQSSVGHRFRVAMLAAASSTTIASLRAASAQPPPPQPTAAKGGIEEIVVTARKRRESAQNVPVSVTVLSAKQIQRYALTSLENIADLVPQLNIGRASAGSGAQITLRGIGSQATSIGLEQSTAVVVDGVYYGQGRVIDEGFMGLSSVELLKGPQALFFGKNATAGVINITTADPTPTFEAMGRVGYEFQARQLIGEGYIAGPITPDLSFRIAGRISNMYGDLFQNHAVATPSSTVDLGTGLAKDGRYSSSYLASSFGEPLSLQDQYINLEASIRLHTEDDRWDLALIGRNLTNSFYISGVLDAPNTGSGTGTNKALPADMLGLANPPRTVLLELTLRY